MDSIIKNLLKRTWFYKYRNKRLSEKQAKKKEMHLRWFHEESEEMFKCFCKALNDVNLVFWMDFGTLLGYYRENDFIKHDFDIDMGTFIENAPSVKDALERNGFKRVRYYYPLDHSGLEEAYKFKHISIDVFYYKKTDESRMQCTGYRLVNHLKKTSLKHFVPMRVLEYTLPYTGFKNVFFKNSMVYVPNDLVLHLETNYGKSFMIPNPQWNELKDGTNIRFYNYDDKPAEGYFLEKWS